MRWSILREGAPQEWPVIPGVLIAYDEPSCCLALNYIAEWDVVGVDVETVGCDPEKEHPMGKARLISLQIASDTDIQIFIPLWGEYEDNLRFFVPWLTADYEVTKVGHNIKYDMHSLANHGVVLEGLLGDTLVMDVLANNAEQRHALKEIMRRDFGEEGAEDYKKVFCTPVPLKRPNKKGETVYGKKMRLQSLDEVVQTKEGIEKLIRYASKDPAYTVQVYRKLKQQLSEMAWTAKGNYFDYYQLIPLPFTRVLFDMEREGAPLDLKHLEVIQERVEEEVIKAERGLVHECAEAGIPASRLEKLNLDSPAQLSKIIYSDFKVEPPKVQIDKKTKKPKAPSTDAKALDALLSKAVREDASDAIKRVAKFVTALLRYRKLATLRKMFIKPLLLSAAHYGNKAITNYKQTGTKTGRISSSTPNLANIPQGKKDEEFELRKAFISGDPDYCIADIDLSQIELRITAHVTQETKLIELLRNNYDQHLQAMTIIFPQVRAWLGDRPPKKEFCEVSDEDKAKGIEAEGPKHFGKANFSELRKRAKILNFGIIYGLSGIGFARQIGNGFSEKEGERIIRRYLDGMPGLSKGIKRVQRKCAEEGFVRTLVGRRVYYPDINDERMWVRSAAERECFNAVIQGTCADFMQMSMVLIHRDQRLKELNVKMILQIYDELVFRMPKTSVKEAKPIIEEYVSRPYSYYGMKPMVVDTPASMGYGDNWAEAK